MSSDQIKIDNLKNLAWIIGTVVILTLYVHQTFATNKRVDKIEERITKQEKIQCLTAIKVGVEEQDLRQICQLH